MKYTVKASQYSSKDKCGTFSTIYWGDNFTDAMEAYSSALASGKISRFEGPEGWIECDVYQMSKIIRS